jgi:hypothetical protein
MRGGVSFKGVGVKTATVKLAAGITAADEGKAVTWTAAQTVGLGADGNPLAGKLIKVEGDGYGTIEYAGFIQVPYIVATTPNTTVNSDVVVDGLGNVKDAATPGAGRGLVADLDATNSKAIVQL